MTVDAMQGATSSAAAASSGASAIGATQDRFLKLLVAQLQNQDPLNPMDNAEMTTQLAQMSTVEGINNLNASFESLLGSMQTSQGLQAASMIGHSVLVKGNTLDSDGTGAQAGIELSGSVDSLVVQVKDADGNVVNSMDLGPQKAGFIRFGWDGMDNDGEAVAAGQYTFSVTAKSAGKSVGHETYAAGLVTGVYLSDTGVKLDVAGRAGSYAFSEIKQVI